MFKENALFCKGIDKGTGIAVISIDTKVVGSQRIKGHKYNTLRSLMLRESPPQINTKNEKENYERDKYDLFFHGFFMLQQ